VEDWRQDVEVKPSPLRRRLTWALVVAVVGVLGFLAWTLLTGSKPQQQRQVVNTVTRLTLPPPPPPPPPPPKADPPPEPQQTRMREPERPMERVEPQQAPKPPGPAPQQLGLPTGPGAPNAYGLGAGGDGTIGGPGGPGGGGGGSRFSGYAAGIQSSVQTALQRDDRTRRGTWRLPVRLWVGAGGEIARIQLVGTTGDPARDQALQQALTGLKVAPPPADLPQPIVLRINARAS
jgi:outer membrane biosynthesis protein TonB